MKTSMRYVEVGYDLPDEQTRFRAVLTEADSPRAAAEKAVAETMLAHPSATSVEEYMQRKVTDEKAQDILNKIAAGTWEGWPIGQAGG